MNCPFSAFFNEVMINFVEYLSKYGFISANDNKMVLHSLKFAKAFMTFSLLSMASTDIKYTFASEEMIRDAFSKTEEEYYIQVGSKKKLKKINPLLEKHFSVIFRELAKCYPSKIIFVGTNVGKDDYEIYAKQQYLEGKPIDIRRIRKIKEKEGIVEKKSGLAE